MDCYGTATDFTLIFNKMSANSSFRTIARGLIVPFVFLALLGTAFVAALLVMAAGGLLSLSDRRLRVGAPRPARRAHAVPAE